MTKYNKARKRVTKKSRPHRTEREDTVVTVACQGDVWAVKSV